MMVRVMKIAEQLNPVMTRLHKRNAISQSVSLFFVGVDSGCSAIAFFETSTSATDCTERANMVVSV